MITKEQQQYIIQQGEIVINIHFDARVKNADVFSAGIMDNLRNTFLKQLHNSVLTAKDRVEAEVSLNKVRRDLLL